MDFRILGPVGSWADNTEVPLNGAKQRTVLAALLLADGRALSDYQLGEVLWGKTPPETYQAQIYTYASRLRQRLKKSAQVIRKGSGYSMRLKAAWFDYREFQSMSRAGHTALRAGQYEHASDLLRGAVDLWRGPTLTGVTDYLIEIEGPRIEEARMETLEAGIAADLALGRHRRLIAELVGLVSVHPLRERLRAQLMLALYESDRQADAFAVFYEGRHQLKEELGVDPGPALRKTYQAILTGEVTEALSEPGTPGTAGPEWSTVG